MDRGRSSLITCCFVAKVSLRGAGGQGDWGHPRTLITSVALDRSWFQTALSIGQRWSSSNAPCYAQDHLSGLGRSHGLQGWPSDLRRPMTLRWYWFITMRPHELRAGDD